MDTLFFTAEVNVMTRNARIPSPQFLAHLRREVMDVIRECAKN
jgi:septum formation topological specificity factor MinE